MIIELTRKEILDLMFYIREFIVLRDADVLKHVDVYKIIDKGEMPKVFYKIRSALIKRR